MVGMMSSSASLPAKLLLNTERPQLLHVEQKCPAELNQTQNCKSNKSWWF